MKGDTFSTISLGYILLAVAAGLSPFFAIFSGTLLTPLLAFIAFFCFISLAAHRKTFSYTTPSSLFLILGFLGYCFISSVWSIAPEASLKLAARLLMLCLSGYLIFVFIKHLPDKYPRIFPLLFCSGLWLSILLLYIEVWTGGVVSSWIKSYKPAYHFELYQLNKSATYLSLISWAGIFIYTGKKKPFIALLLWLTILALLYQLESVSAFTAYIFASLTYLFISFFYQKGLTLLTVSTCSAMLLIPFSFLFIDADKLSNDYAAMPESAKHRLYIWEFTSHKALEKPLLGYGLASSRHLPINAEDIKVPLFDPLPIHPHNNLLHVWLELGLTGLVLAVVFVAGIFLCIKQQPSVPYKAASTAVLISYITIGMFSYSMWHNWWIASGFFAVIFLIKTEKEPLKET